MFKSFLIKNNNLNNLNKLILLRCYSKNENNSIKDKSVWENLTDILLNNDNNSKIIETNKLDNINLNDQLKSTNTANLDQKESRTTLEKKSNVNNLGTITKSTSNNLETINKSKTNNNLKPISELDNNNLVDDGFTILIEKKSKIKLNSDDEIEYTNILNFIVLKLNNKLESNDDLKLVYIKIVDQWSKLLERRDNDKIRKLNDIIKKSKPFKELIKRTENLIDNLDSECIMIIKKFFNLINLDLKSNDLNISNQFLFKLRTLNTDKIYNLIDEIDNDDHLIDESSDDELINDKIEFNNKISSILNPINIQLSKYHEEKRLKFIYMDSINRFSKLNLSNDLNADTKIRRSIKNSLPFKLLLDKTRLLIDKNLDTECLASIFKLFSLINLDIGSKDLKMIIKKIILNLDQFDLNDVNDCLFALDYYNNSIDFFSKFNELLIEMASFKLMNNKSYFNDFLNDNLKNLNYYKESINLLYNIKEMELNIKKNRNSLLPKIYYDLIKKSNSIIYETLKSDLKEDNLDYYLFKLHNHLIDKKKSHLNIYNQEILDLLTNYIINNLDKQNRLSICNLVINKNLGINKINRLFYKNKFNSVSYDQLNKILFE